MKTKTAKKKKYNERMIDKDGLTYKQRIFRSELFKTFNPTEAAMKAYDCKNKNVAAVIASQNLKKLNISFADLMERMGLTDEEDIKDLMRMRKATKQISCNIYIKKNGEMKGADGNSLDFIEVDDNQIQLKALELTMKLKGHLRDKVEHDVTFTMNKFMQVIYDDRNGNTNKTRPFEQGNRLAEEIAE